MNLPTSISEYNQQGKSNNYIQAKEGGKLTVGEAAKLLSKRFGCKILAKTIEPLSVEFHHAGRFGNNKAKRIFFFTKEQIESLTLEDINESGSPRWGWIMGFKKEYGQYGRKHYIPIIKEVGLIDGSRVFRLGDKFHPLEQKEINECQAKVGKILPTFSDNWREAS
jgi:hypothetical protein